MGLVERRTERQVKRAKRPLGLSAIVSNGQKRLYLRGSVGKGQRITESPRRERVASSERKDSTTRMLCSAPAKSLCTCSYNHVTCSVSVSHALYSSNKYIFTLLFFVEITLAFSITEDAPCHKDDLVFGSFHSHAVLFDESALFGWGL